MASLHSPVSLSCGTTTEHICPCRFPPMIFRGQVIDKNSGAFCGEDDLWDNHFCIETNLQHPFIFRDSFAAMSLKSKWTLADKMNIGWQSKHFQVWGTIVSITVHAWQSGEISALKD